MSGSTSKLSLCRVLTPYKKCHHRQFTRSITKASKPIDFRGAEGDALKYTDKPFAKN